jgi:hypothetical protein
MLTYHFVHFQISCEHVDINPVRLILSNQKLDHVANGRSSSFRNIRIENCGTIVGRMIIDNNK